MNKTTWALIAILALALAVRLVALTSPLWHDEAYTAVLVRKPLGEMAIATAGDVHTPTYYILPWLSTRLLGESELTLRLPSLAMGLVAIVMVYKLARRASGHKVALVAAFLMSINPFEVYYSNEARMYALLTVAALLAGDGAINQQPWKLAAGSALTLGSHNMGALYLPALGLVAWGKRGWSRKGFIKAAWPMALGLLPVAAALLPMMAGQVKRLDSGFWIHVFSSNLVMTLVDNVRMLLFGHDATGPLTLPTGVLAVGLMIFPMWHAAKRKRYDLMALTLGPIASMLAVSEVWQPMILYRTMAGALPTWLILIAEWVTSIKLDAPRKAMVVLVLVVFGLCLVGYYVGNRDYMDDISIINKFVNAGDTLCHADAMIEYYLNRPINTDLNTCNVVMVTDYPTMTAAEKSGVVETVRAHGGVEIGHFDSGPLVSVSFYRIEQK